MVHGEILIKPRMQVSMEEALACCVLDGSSLIELLGHRARPPHHLIMIKMVLVQVHDFVDIF